MGDAARRRMREMASQQHAMARANTFQDNLEYEPCDDLLLLERTDKEQTAGGLYIPENARAQHMPRWRVLKTGPGRLSSNGSLIPMRIRPGMEVLINHDRGGVFSVPNQTHQVLATESCVLAIITERKEEEELQ